MALILAVYFQAWDKAPLVQSVDNSLEGLQKVVEGNIEHFDLTDELVVVLNEYGKIEKRPPVRAVVETMGPRSFRTVDTFNSPFIVTRMSPDGDYVHLTDADIAHVLKWQPNRAWGYAEAKVLENVLVKKEQFL